MNFLQKLIIFLIIYFILYTNQTYIFHQLISKPKLYFWMRNQPELKKLRDNIKNYGDFDRYYDTLEPNKKYEYIAPIFDKSIILKKYVKEQFNHNLFSKENALPYIINMFTTPRTIFGQWKGDSIFRTDFSKRGPNNRLKEFYMQGLQQIDLDNYRKVFAKYFDENVKKNLKVDYFDFIQDINIDLTYLVHYNRLPTQRDREDCYLFIHAVRSYHFTPEFIDKQIRNLDGFFKRNMMYIQQSKKENCLIGKWVKYGNIPDNDIFMEFIHNILGMAINWTNMMYSYVLEYGKGNIPPIPNDKTSLKPYLYETIRYINPVRYTASKSKKPEMFGSKNDNLMVVHDLKLPTRMPEFFEADTDKFMIDRLKNYKKDTIEFKGKCPMSGFFESPKGAKVACGMELYEKEGYIGFGEGYRRCPGEHLTLVLLEELANHIKTLDYEIILKGGKSDLMSYVWGSVDKNLVLHIS